MQKSILFLFFIICCLITGMVSALLLYRGSDPLISSPTTIRIPAIHINARVESVGLDSEGHMAVPKVPANVAWYNLGPKPGEDGNAVIDGHIDTITGEPAVFV